MFLLSWADNLKARAEHWAQEKAHGKQAKWWLAAIALTEASFQPLPPDVMLIAILVAGADRWMRYAGLTTVASVVGGIFGYAIGVLLYDTVGKSLIDAYGLSDTVALVGKKFADNAFWTVFVSAFTPIPYKVFTISAGLFGINFFIFTVASFLGRGLRFFALGYAMRLFGARIGVVAFRYFNIILLAAVIAIVALFVLAAFL